MNKKQWTTLSIGLGFLGLFFMAFAIASYCPINELLTACYVRRYAYAIPGLICIGLGIIFGRIAKLEKK